METVDGPSETSSDAFEATLASTTIPAAIDRAVRLFGDREGLVDGTGPDAIRLTFAELAEQIDVAAQAFVAAGIQPGDRICIWGPNGLRWLLAALGGYRAGAVLVPLNTRFKGAEAAYVLRTAGVRMLFTVTDFLDTDYTSLLTGDNAVETLEQIVVISGDVPDGRVSWDEFIAAGSGVDRAEVIARSAAIQPDDISDIMFTSGTTGKPKGAMIRHGASVRGFDAWATVVGLRAGDRYLIVNPFFHTFGLKAGIIACLVKGATIVPQPVFDVPAVMRRIPEERISMIPGPPSIYQTILDHPDRAQYDLSSLRLAVTGAAPVSVELVRRMREELGFETVVTGYGLTETTGIVTMCRHDDPDEIIANTSGRAIPDVEVRLVDDNGVDVEVGQPGEIWARGYNVMAGYFGNPDATAEVLNADGWLATGDVAVQDAQGNVQITDRKKDMFIMGGFNAYPAEIENALAGYPGVSQVAVIGVPDHRMGEVGKAYIVPRPGATVVPDEVIAWSRANMANYKVPRFVEVVESLPMNASGKVLKGDLRARNA
ncbi:MAG: AMP-dependent synthetase and ligase [Ilumatobacteraceae bacterium]|nr:AMP-dependent synthetase and ligase [Ilumatobacteraceae bacterium]